MKFYQGEGILTPTAPEKGNLLGLHNLLHKALAKNASMLRDMAKKMLLV